MPVAHAIDQTQVVWPVRVCRARPVAGSHTRTVPSKLAVARSSRPSAPVAHATDKTPLVWPVRVTGGSTTTSPGTHGSSHHPAEPAGSAPSASAGTPP